jgi:hypothetical protein
VTRISSAHHVFGIEHLLSQFWHGEGSVLLGSSGGQGGETSHEKVKTREGDHVDSNFTKIAVQLTWETNAAGSSRHSSRYQVVQITISGGGQFQGSETDII